ncbi:hypothetical protein ACFQ6C_25795 [Streptomyces sp. NPDC056454]|uniref:hypothetical protein n=1 Tax=Streptomyces sp. NPDC056454 TaxID=3345823 RepID=UPI0036B4565C
MTRTPKISPAGQRALTAMRARHDGALGSGEGFAITTMRPLERAGLITLSTWRAADRTLSTATRSVQFTATLTDDGWAEHPRPAAPERPVPTPESELLPGDVVANVHTGSAATWFGPSALAPDTYVTQTAGATMNTGPGCWVFVSRPEPTTAPGDYVAWAEGPQERTEHGYVAAQADGEALVLGLDGAFRRMPAAIPEPADAPSARLPLPESVPAANEPETVARSARGLLFEVGRRATYRSRDGFTHSGEIKAITTGADQRTMVTFDADQRTITPARRRTPGIPPRPGKIIPISPPKPWTVSIDDSGLTPDR